MARTTMTEIKADLTPEAREAIFGEPKDGTVPWLRPSLGESLTEKVMRMANAHMLSNIRASIIMGVDMSKEPVIVDGLPYTGEPSADYSIDGGHIEPYQNKARRRPRRPGSL